MLKNFISNYFSFTRKERTGVLVLLALILFFIALPFLFPLFIKKKQADHAVFEKAIASLKLKQQDSSDLYPKRNAGADYGQHYSPSEKNHYSAAPKGELFYFDPNTLAPDGWKKLGTREKTVSTIQNYLAKGGRFREPADIGKIWGLNEDEVKRLTPYVKIVERSAAGFSEKKNFQDKPYVRKENKIIPFDINTADTTAFIALPGIGSKLAARIIAFREKLGGFYAVEQVAETYALPDSTFQKIKNNLLLAHPVVKQFNINTATVDEMKVHPYIRYSLAGAIVQYRTQHGNYSGVSDIKKIMMVTDEIYKKLAPYLSVQ